VSVQDKQRKGRKLRIAVLMGGSSSEREVSLVSGQMIAKALDRDKYDVMTLDTRDLFRLTGGHAPALEAAGVAGTEGSAIRTDSTALPAASATSGMPAGVARPDVVFIALHGKGGEDGTVQGMLEVMGLPYTGSGVLASALAMDKVMSKRVFKAAGIPVIDGIYVSRAGVFGCTEEAFNGASLCEIEANLGFPVFVKPNAGGSTCGCTLVTSAEQLYAAVHEALKFDDTVLIEKYVRGTEITIGVLDFPGERLTALPVIEIVPKGEYYDYESKYAAGGSEHIIPARLSVATTERAQQIARECHALLGCHGVSRTDIIVSDDRLYVLEVNTIPGMTPTSLLPQAAEHAGIPFSELLDRIIRSAIDGN
jgi:D-alanine-D-alanine ligase